MFEYCIVLGYGQKGSEKRFAGSGDRWGTGSWETGPISEKFLSRGTPEIRSKGSGIQYLKMQMMKSLAVSM